ncbi:hypothetical protein [Halonatronum saccharophilum]|uniref:hypothetical protein n=1 Tax=Halonatronum saccharophilum TaxID=150060 RepID=UPI0004B31DDE|nr:hypothetical protein [Halonatronum saccharophilum]
MSNDEEKKYVICAKCGKKVEKGEEINYKIRSIRNFGRGGKRMKFCSGECAKNMQFAME